MVSVAELEAARKAIIASRDCNTVTSFTYIDEVEASLRAVVASKNPNETAKEATYNAFWTKQFFHLNERKFFPFAAKFTKDPHFYLQNVGGLTWPEKFAFMRRLNTSDLYQYSDTFLDFQKTLGRILAYSHCYTPEYLTYSAMFNKLPEHLVVIDQICSNDVPEADRHFLHARNTK
jgi:hypothetical protein